MERRSSNVETTISPRANDRARGSNRTARRLHPTTTTTSPATVQTQTVSPVCSAAAAYAASLTNFKDTLKPSATLEQVRSAADQVVKAFDDLLR